MKDGDESSRVPNLAASDKLGDLGEWDPLQALSLGQLGRFTDAVSAPSEKDVVLRVNHSDHRLKADEMFE
ncbi:UNVERIFIED_ORG: hypothetical protein CLV66_103459 [Actinomadura viridilutea]